MAQKLKPHQKLLHASADYYEPLFRGRFVRAMQQVQKDTSINSLAMQLGNARQAKDVIPRAAIVKALTPLKKVLVDAYMRGGKLGADHLRDTLRRG